MRRFVDLVVVVVTLAATFPALAQDKPILAVMDIEDKTGKFKPGDLEGTTDFLRTRLVESGGYQVVDKMRQGERRVAVVNELRRESHSPCYDRKCRIKLGQALAADTLLACSVTAVGKTCILGCEITRLETEAVVAAASVRFECTIDNLLGVVGHAVARLSGRKDTTSGESGPKTVVEGKIGETPDEWEPVTTQRAIVEIKSDPPGAAVIADGNLLCQSTPCSKALTLGVHEMSIAVEGERYQPRKETVTISKGSSVDWKLTPNFGLLTVRSEPAGLDVKLDGKVVGKTPLEKMEVSIGGHEVLVTSECHYDGGERVNIERGAHRQVTVSLIGKQGIVDVVAEDQNGNAVRAEVFVDNERLGHTPDVFKVSICSKLLRVRRQGYREFTRSISIAERTTTPVTAKLKSVSPTPTYPTPSNEPGHRERLAVLQLNATTAGFTSTYLEFLTDKIRQTVRDRLGDKYEFMSKEAILQIVLGTECPATGEAGYDLEVGQQLMADLLVTGTVFKEGSVIRYTLKLMRVHQGVVLKILTGEPSYNAKQLEKKIAGAAEELLSALTKGIVEISSIPMEARVEVDRSGKATCVTPCELMLNPGRHVITVYKEGFFPTDIEVILSPSTKNTLTIALKPRR